MSFGDKSVYGFYAARPLSRASVDPVICPRCRRTVERAATVNGDHGFAVCAEGGACRSASVPRRPAVRYEAL